MGSNLQFLLRGAVALQLLAAALGTVAFEKLTGYDFRGTTYYTIQNLSLWECQGWCKEEPECAAASYSFVVNPLAPVQETLCLLQNETLAANPTAQPQRAVSLYYMIKLSVRSDKVCKRPWQFERVPSRRLRGRNNAEITTNNKEDCVAACLNEDKFVCRSAEYNYLTLQCHLSEHDRRTVPLGVELENSPGIDYFENLCLDVTEACRTQRSFREPSLGISSSQVAQFVNMRYYVDKELMANSRAACERGCLIEYEFLCRSFLYLGPPSPNSYNCHLFHLDHHTLPGGKGAFTSPDRSLLDDGKRTGKYFENRCASGSDGGSTNTGGSNGSGSSSNGSGTGSITTSRPDTGTSGNTGDVNCDPTGVCYDVSVHCKDTRIAVEVKTNKKFNGRIYALGRSETCNIAVINSDRFRLDLTMAGQDCNTQSITGVYTNTVVIQHHSVVMTKTDKIYKIRCTYDMSPKNITFGMMPIRDPDMIPITSAPEAPRPRIRILDATMQEVQTVRIGDRLTFRIEIPESTPYGIFARSCVAMAKDSRSTFKIIDDNGCPVEPSIFPQFELAGSALQSMYDAFRFTESYGVIFQCNVKYCLGVCKPARCQNGRDQIESYGRRKRSVEMDLLQAVAGSFDRRGRSLYPRGQAQQTTKEEALVHANIINGIDKSSDEEMSISQEILVLDVTEELENTRKQAEGNSSYPKYDDSVGQVPVPLTFTDCPTRTSVLALAATSAVLLITYVLTVFYFITKKWLGHNNKSSRRR